MTDKQQTNKEQQAPKGSYRAPTRAALGSAARMVKGYYPYGYRDYRYGYYRRCRG